MKYQEKKLGRPRKGVTYKNNPERVIVAKYKGYCRECLKDFPAGEWIKWSPDEGPKHQKC